MYGLSAVNAKTSHRLPGRANDVFSDSFLETETETDRGGGFCVVEIHRAGQLPKAQMGQMHSNRQCSKDKHILSQLSPSER